MGLIHQNHLGLAVDRGPEGRQRLQCLKYSRRQTPSRVQLVPHVMTQAGGSKGQQAGLPGVQAVKEQLQGQRGFSRAAAAGHHHERRPAVFENG
jgi:hypothetical protein